MRKFYSSGGSGGGCLYFTKGDEEVMYRYTQIIGCNVICRVQFVVVYWMFEC